MVMVADGVLLPRHGADMARQLRRRQMPQLPKGRPVLPATSQNREELFTAFSRWCMSQNLLLETLLESALANVEEINAILSAYGKALYAAGRPYGHFAETINSVVSQRPVLRRNLQQAWDYAFAWVRAEPPTHHLACPWQVLLAIISTALLWGWTKVAGVCALYALEGSSEWVKSLTHSDMTFCCPWILMGQTTLRFWLSQNPRRDFLLPDISLVRLMLLTSCVSSP